MKMIQALTGSYENKSARETFYRCLSLINLQSAVNGTDYE